jgi:hypothetical protein
MDWLGVERFWENAQTIPAIFELQQRLNIGQMREALSGLSPR